MITRVKPPYDRTEIDVDKTQMEIQKLILQYGAEGIRCQDVSKVVPG